MTSRYQHSLRFDVDRCDGVVAAGGDDGHPVQTKRGGGDSVRVALEPAQLLAAGCIPQRQQRAGRISARAATSATATQGRRANTVARISQAPKQPSSA